MDTLLIDNDDSFTWNLWQMIRSLGHECTVRLHTALTVRDIERMRPERIVLSPGPGSPKDATLACTVIRELSANIPMLGVCLGHQCIAHVFGREDAVGHAPIVMHGKTSAIRHTGTGIFSGLTSPMTVARYHSLLVKKLPPDFELLAWHGKQIMAMRHTMLPLSGVQFHPESFLTQHGGQLMGNFLSGTW